MGKTLIVKEEGKKDVEIDILDGKKKDYPYHIKKGLDGLHFKTQKSLTKWAERRFPKAKISID